MPSSALRRARAAGSAAAVTTACASVAGLLGGALLLLPGNGVRGVYEPAARPAPVGQAQIGRAAAPQPSTAPQGVEQALHVNLNVSGAPKGDGGEVVPGTVAVALVGAPLQGDRIAWPTANHTITSPFGVRRDPITDAWRMHTGVDFGAACGDAITAAAPGEVIGAGPAGSYGNRVVVLHADRDGKRFSTSYNHLERVDVKVGQRLKAGDRIGANGTTGYSTGCHLHFETMVDGRFVDPMPLITGQPSTAQLTIPVGAEMPSGPIVGPTTVTPMPTPSPSASGASSAPSKPAPSAPAVPPPPAPSVPAPSVPAPSVPAPPVPAPTVPSAPPVTTPPSLPPAPPPTSAPAPTAPTAPSAPPPPTCVPRPPAPPTTAPAPTAPTAPNPTAKPTAPPPPPTTAPLPSATNGTPYCTATPA